MSSGSTYNGIPGTNGPVALRCFKLLARKAMISASHGAMLDILDIELQLHVLSCYCLPREILRFGATNRQANSLTLSLPVSLSRFPLGSKVRIKPAIDLLRAFEVANRLDLTELETKDLEGQVGVVVRRHATNGIGVKLCPGSSEEVEPIRWLEPICLNHVGVPPPRDGMTDVRFFSGQKVRVNGVSEHSEWQGKVGTVFLRHQPSDDKVLVRYAGQEEELLRPEFLEQTGSFFGGGSIQASLSLEPFELDCIVQVREKRVVMAGFDAANRDDYFGYMDDFCNQFGVVDLLHPTNGIRVCFDGGFQLWYEPPCLRKIGEALFKTSASTSRRLLVGQRVRLNHKSSPYHGRLGLIQLHFHERDYTKVTVRFSDGHEEYVKESSVTLVKSRF